jgi:hypothetical protein
MIETRTGPRSDRNPTPSTVSALTASDLDQSAFVDNIAVL